MGTTKTILIFLAKGLFLLLLAAVSIMGLFLMMPMDGYMPGHQMKLERLQSLDSPKLVLAGGSSVAMSVDSSRLQEAMQMPVVNMGLHAGIGMRFMLDEAERYSGKGDMILMVGEYQHLFGLLNGEIGLLRLVRSNPALALKFSSPEQWFQLVAHFSYLWEGQIRKLIKKQKTGKPIQDRGARVMNQQGLNSWGDLVTHLGKPSPGIGDRRVFDGSEQEIDREAVEFLRNKAQALREKEVRLFWMFPPIPERDYRTFSNTVEMVEHSLTSIDGLEVLASPVGSIYPVNLFYDTEYHLAESGRSRYTQHLIDCLSHKK